MSKAIDNLAEMINPSPETVSHRDEVAALRAVHKSLKRELGDRSQIIAEIKSEVVHAPPLPKQYTPPRGKKAVNSPCVAVMHCTDWHIGSVIQGSEIEHFNQFNLEIATERVSTLAKKFIEWTQLHRSSYRVDELVILGTGDWISGDIHHELVATNEFPTPVQAVKAGYLFGNMLGELAPHFAKIRVEFVTLDNHGRLTKKCQSAEGGFNNFSFVTGCIARERVIQCKNVEFNIYPHSTQVVNVAGYRYLCGHGHGIIGTFGIPFYGIERRKQREAMARINMAEESHFHKIIIGHFHTSLNHQDWMIGGSLTGTDAFDHGQGRHSPPHQTGWMVHPKHGEFNWWRIWL